ncbi:DUF1496 domain-containing protein [Caballeronia sordidicola]|uniref:Uncharacterized protein n=1 Tax=Caballeronia sordidicola TaxID=196367 RepID=A0A242MVC6_CABSO|nr:DUF1496 domain-containing protein [Caballeronia sordidicola]OTP75399.1 hypothetical protein PAMC26577_13320 [Caballeronia sordidicola]
MKNVLSVVVAFGLSNAAIAQSQPDAQLTQQQVAGQLQNNEAYCVYDNRLYSLGAKHEGQVCVPNKPFGDEHNPPQWVSSQQAARGNY